MKMLTLAIAASAITYLSVAAFAQEGAAPAAPAAPEAAPAAPDAPKLRGRLSELDANNDGAIDAAEFATMQNLRDADANKDGTLSGEELVAMIQKLQAERAAQRMSRRLDIDGDGTVTIAELEKNRQERFALMDRNDDGKLEGNELRRGGHDGGRGRYWRRHDRHNRHHDGRRGDRRGGDMDL